MAIVPIAWRGEEACENNMGQLGCARMKITFQSTVVVIVRS